MSDRRPRIIYAAKRSGRIIYIGQTRDLRTRVRHHKAHAPWYEDGVFFTKLTEVWGSDEADRVEADLIARHKPEGNIHHAPARPRLDLLPSSPSLMTIREIADEMSTGCSWARRVLVRHGVQPVARIQADTGKGNRPMAFRRSDVESLIHRYKKLERGAA